MWDELDEDPLSRICEVVTGLCVLKVRSICAGCVGGLMVLTIK